MSNRSLSRDDILKSAVFTTKINKWRHNYKTRAPEFNISSCAILRTYDHQYRADIVTK